MNWSCQPWGLKWGNYGFADKTWNEKQKQDKTQNKKEKTNKNKDKWPYLGLNLYNGLVHVEAFEVCLNHAQMTIDADDIATSQIFVTSIYNPNTPNLSLIKCKMKRKNNDERSDFSSKSVGCICVLFQLLTKTT